MIPFVVVLYSIFNPILPLKSLVQNVEIIRLSLQLYVFSFFILMALEKNGSAQMERSLQLLHSVLSFHFSLPEFKVGLPRGRAQGAGDNGALPYGNALTVAMHNLVIAVVLISECGLYLISKTRDGHFPHM